MLKEIGSVESLYQYPVKSISGEQLEFADLGWHSLDGWTSSISGYRVIRCP